MKTRIFLILIPFILSRNNILADVIFIPPGAHLIESCIFITNLDEFEGIVFYGTSHYVNFGGSWGTSSIIKDSTCIDRNGPFYYAFNLYAKNSAVFYHRDESLYGIDNYTYESSVKLEPGPHYISDDLPYTGTTEYYKIVGFDPIGRKMILYKWKEILSFADRPDSIQTFDFNGDTSNLTKGLPPYYKFIKKDVRISNIDEFPDAAIIAYDFDRKELKNCSYQIIDTNCLTKKNISDNYRLYAVRSSFLESVDINNCDWPNIKDKVPSYPNVDVYFNCTEDTTSISKIEEYYKILGFTATHFYLHKYKEITKYNNGLPDKINQYSYYGDTSKLSKNIIITDLKLPSAYFDVKVFPNPSAQTMVVQLPDNYSGEVILKVFTTDGKLVKKKQYIKKNTTDKINLDINGLQHGIYFLKIEFGQNLVTNKIIVN